MDVVYHEEALRDLDEISGYYRDHAGQTKAEEIVDRIREVIAARARVEFGKAAFYNVEDDVYEVPVSHLPQLVVYRLRARTMLVVAVFNTRRDPGARRRA